MKKKLLFLLIPLLISGMTGCVKYNGKGKNRGKTTSTPAVSTSTLPDSGSQGQGSSQQDNTSSQPSGGGNSSSSSDELPLGTEVKVYLVFGEYGLYQNNPVNTKVEALFLEHTMELTAKVGDRLPTRDDVTSSVTNSKFVAWTAYNNDGKLTEYTKVPGYQNKILYASFGGGNGGGGTSGGSSGGGEQGGGGQQGGGETPVTLTYTVSNLPDWIQNDGCVIFAWAWDEQGNGAWKSLTYGTNSDASFTVDKALQGFLLARCAGGTTEPNWGMQSGDGAGRIYNKTNDITCSPNVYSYICADWVGYPG